MNLELKNKIALVTGASSGIGAAVALTLAEEGADVVLVYNRDHAGASQHAQRIASNGGRAWLRQMDLSDPEDISAAIEQLKADVDRLDMLILCAGYNRVTPLQEITPDESDKVLNINLSGVFYLVQAALPLMSEGGSIITVASVAAHTGALTTCTMPLPKLG